MLSMDDFVFLDVYTHEETWDYLFRLLQERHIPTESISHQAMPKFHEHLAFVNSRPYKDWRVLLRKSEDYTPRMVGAVYLSKADEIGIQIGKGFRRKGYGKLAVRWMIDQHYEVKRFLANINPNNMKSFEMFSRLGFSDCQITLQWRRPDGIIVRRVEAGVRNQAGSDEAEAAAEPRESLSRGEAPFGK